ncbi:CLUMA_CG008993, isoform A [Clunio marinus]|uniref:CLUMA_CG008993, isoform A n=1 Tax=Clunio marinus TaxID=568069 RepID=A0A1J1I7G9_9DIPT|nr:CLUMA_CG008993, isoform A [Clunio marinus]
MSDQHRGYNDAVWWPGAITATDQSNLHHQQIINQHHQQNHMQQQPQQQIHQVVVQQQSQALNDLNRANSTTSTVATQQLFSYKMASSFPTSGVTVSTSNTPAAYDYRLGMGSMNQTHIQNANQNNQIAAKMGRGKGGADAKPRGRMTAYAFFVQTCREEHKKKHPEESVIFAEFSRKCAERWKTMLDKEKKRFHEMAEKDKQRYDMEMSNYVPPKGVVVGRGKKRKHVKDPNAPKRSLSAFFWFCHDERSKVKALNPEYGVGDIAKELGRKWSDCVPEVKGKYEAMADKDKQRYERVSIHILLK